MEKRIDLANAAAQGRAIYGRTHGRIPLPAAFEDIRRTRRCPGDDRWKEFIGDLLATVGSCDLGLEI
ncbi:unnamed protein product [Nezara viridula]|uniref:Uncharacterized protein n=1 Tax=Nezara viridula TaxID=85310 RepID=A0A9P0MX04_NEZVI|nr:unnamed protein product [Nezara viridula]